MAKISYRKNGGAITFDQNDWLSGLNPQFTTDLTGTPALQVGNGLSTAGSFNPFRFLGYASPGFQLTNITNVSVVTAFLRNIALGSESSTTYGYAIGSNNLLHRLDVLGKTLSNSGSWPRTISGAGTVTGFDVVAYNARVGSLSSSSPCAFYSYNNSDATTTWNIGRFIMPTNAFADTFMTVTPATPLIPTTTANGGSNLPHPMIIGADDVLYVGDGNRLHAYDGAVGINGTFAANVLTLPQGYVITSFAPVSQPTPFLVVFAYYNAGANSITPDTTSGGQAKAFFYDYLSLDPTYVVDLDDRVVTAGFAWKGTIGCFTAGSNLVNDSEDRNFRLKIWNGSIFETSATFIEEPPIHGGVDIVGDSIQWAAGITGQPPVIYSFGSPFEGTRAGLNRIGVGTGGTSRGLLRTVGGVAGYQVLSCGTTTSGGLQFFSKGTYTDGASVATISIQPEFSEGMKGKVTSVRIDFGKTSTASGRSLNAYVVTESGGTSQILSSLALVDSTNITKTYYTPISNVDGAFSTFFEIRPLLQWTSGSGGSSAPVVRRIVVNYDEVNIENT